MRALRSKVLVVVLASLAAAGCKKARINGRVVDNFGKPVPAATISIDGTAFRATTDDKGEYSIDYVPGNFMVNVSHDGFTSASRGFQLAQKDEVPADSVLLFRLPPGPGIFAITDSGYAALGSGTLSSTHTEYGLSFNDPNFYQNMAQGAAFADAYRVTGEFTRVPAGGLRFLDNDNVDNDFEYVFALGDNGSIVRRVYYRSMEHEDVGRWSKPSDQPVGGGMAIRQIDLPPGKYAFAPFSPSIQRREDGFGRRMFSPGRSDPLGSPVWLFMVQ